MENNGKKLVIGWFTLTCSEDSTILFTELLNDHFDEWKKIIEFRHIKSLKTKNTLEGLDVAFVEGAVSSDTQAQEAQKIRDNSKYVVAIGECACTGMPSASRNAIKREDINEKIEWYMSHFPYNEKVKKLDDVIKVDDMVRGCPMDPKAFSVVMEKYLKLFGVI
ncbi:MAG: hypothetical protein WC243_00520 [Patescibacteria group bacterium]|jgi:coenzyme F420-reducing hydrogenase gamma subunit